MDLKTAKFYVDLAASAATALGAVTIVIAVIVFFVEKQRARRDMELLVYDAPHREYIDYLRLCLENPELDVADFPRAGNSVEEHKTRLILVILVSMLERAFLLYNTTHQVPQQWQGWAGYIHDWTERPVFRDAWRDIGGQFDERFTRYVDALLPPEHRLAS